MTEALRLRLQLAVGGGVTLGDELPTLGGRRVFRTRLADGKPARLVLHPLPPEGPSPEALTDRAARLRELDHPALVLPVRTGSLEGRGWVLEAEPGTTARDRLEERGPFPVREGVRALRDVTRALAVMHRRGLSHGALTVDQVGIGMEGTRIHGLFLSDGGTPQGDLAALGPMADALFYGALPGGGRTTRRLPAELAKILAALESDDPARRPARAEALLDLLDAFPVDEASPLDAILDGAGRGARSRSINTAFGVGVLIVVILLVALLVVSRL